MICWAQRSSLGSSMLWNRVLHLVPFHMCSILWCTESKSQSALVRIVALKTPRWVLHFSKWKHENFDHKSKRVLAATLRGSSVDKERRWSLLTLDQPGVTPLTIFSFTSHWNSSYFRSSCFRMIYTQTPRCCDLVRVLGWWIQLVLWKVRISRSSTLPRCEPQITWA